MKTYRVKIKAIKEIKFYGDFPGKYYNRLYEFREQVYGQTEPVQFPEKFKDSIRHRATWFILMGPHASRGYQLMDYRNTGITEEFYNQYIKTEYCGASEWGEKQDKGNYTYSAGRGLEIAVDYFTKPYFTLSHRQALKTINEILRENADIKQLSLF